MDSSVHLSEFGSPQRRYSSQSSPQRGFSNQNSMSEIQDFNSLDEEISFLRDKIAEIQAQITISNEQLQESQSQYQIELSNLANQIESAQEESKDNFMKENERHEMEIQQLQNAFQEEKMLIEKHVRHFMVLNDQFEQSQREIMDLHTNSVMIDNQRQIENEKSLQIDEYSVHQAKQIQKDFEKKMRQYAVKKRVKLLEQEVNDLTSSRREMETQNRFKSSEILSKLDIKALENDLILKKLSKELENRETQFISHIKLVKQTIESERNAIQNELQLLDSETQTFRALENSISKRTNDQLTVIDHDIRHMESFLENSQQSDSQFSNWNQERNRKLYQLERSTNNFRRSASELSNQLSRTRNEKDFSISQIQKYSTPKKPTMSFSQKHSIFT